MKPYTALLWFMLSGLIVHAGDRNITNDQKLLYQYLNQASFAIDTTAQAVILHEKGTVMFFQGIFFHKIEKTIKILSMDAVHLGAVTIPYNKEGIADDLSGTTYNMDDGQIVKQSVSGPEILEERIDKNIRVTKFNLPSVKAGSIIHYTYTVKMPGGSLFIPDWLFQGEYPKLCSEFEMNLPDRYIYSVATRTDIPMKASGKEKDLETCSSCYFDNSYNETSTRYWVRRNVPAFKKEDYMGSEANYLEALKIRVSGIQQQGVTVSIVKDWAELSKDFFFKDAKGCGQAFDRNSFLENQVNQLTQGTTDDLTKARAIYSYVRDNFSYAGGGRQYDNIQQVFEDKKGSQLGVNVLLTAMLRKAGLNSAPVLISTRDHERLDALYPTPVPINYLASVCRIGKQQYFLDATVKQLPFGTLLPECYNGYCRIVNEKGESAVLEPDSLLDKTSVFVTLAPYAQDRHKLLLKIQRQMGTLSGFFYRRAWQKDSVQLKNELGRDWDKSPQKLSLLHMKVSNMDHPDEKLLIEYEALMDLGTSAGTIYFDPYFVKFHDSNPFKAAERRFSVERSYKEDMNYVLNFQLPDDYEMDDYPKSTMYKFGEPGLIVLKNIMNYREAERNFTLNSRLTSYTTVFAPGEYNDLRSFYEKVVEEQHKKIVLKKR